MRQLPSNAWQELETTLFGHVHKAAWERIEKQFNFRASMNPELWPGIAEPTPSVTYSIAAAFTEERYEETNKRFLQAFRKCTSAEQKLYVLDWQHESFWFYPHGETDENDFGNWPICVIPDGDYYIFLAEDFSFGTFGHPWEQTLCVFGQQLVDEIESDKPIYFNEIRRKP